MDRHQNFSQLQSEVSYIDNDLLDILLITPGTACGLASFWGRLFSIVSPLAAAQVLKTSQNGVLYMAGGGAIISTVFICLLPRRYINGQNY